MGFLRAQGATEYLVLLAVVLIVALVSVALLGFFPGMAQDSKITQSEMYWKSASPIAITEWGARVWTVNAGTYPYVRVKNNGAYPIRITGIIGGDGSKITQFQANPSCGLGSGAYNISDYFYLAPGEEKYFADKMAYGTACDWYIGFITGASYGTYVGNATSVCANSTSAPGTLQFNSFGFEYIQYMDNQPITKRQIGQKMIIKCGASYP